MLKGNEAKEICKAYSEQKATEGISKKIALGGFHICICNLFRLNIKYRVSGLHAWPWLHSGFETSS